MTEKSTKTPKPGRAASKPARRPFARHGRITVPSKASALGGLFVKALGLALGASIALVGVSVAGLSDQVSANGITLTDANGNALPKVSAADLKGPINMLLVGSDTRANQGGSFGDVSSTLADVIILLHISEDRKSAVALSFPRDLLVPWPRCPSTTGGPGYLPQSLGQINATIANGGPGCTLLTVEKLTGVKIPYLAMINFKGVIEMSNAIGGVEVCVANDINDEYTNTYLKAGKHVLQGRQALEFLRTRHGVGDGSDLSRISNQQVFMRALARKVKDQGILTNPVMLYSLANAAARNMQLSDSLNDVGTLVGLAQALRNVELQDLVFLQVPARGGLPAPYSGRVMPIYELADPIFKKIRNDEPIKKVSSSSGSSASPSPTASASSSSGSSGSDLPPGSRATDGSDTGCSN